MKRRSDNALIKKKQTGFRRDLCAGTFFDYTGNSRVIVIASIPSYRKQRGLFQKHHWSSANELFGMKTDGSFANSEIIVVSWQLLTFQFFYRAASFQEGEITNDVFEADFNGLDVYCALLSDKMPHLWKNRKLFSIWSHAGWCAINVDTINVASFMK